MYETNLSIHQKEGLEYEKKKGIEKNQSSEMTLTSFDSTDALPEESNQTTSNLHPLDF